MTDTEPRTLHCPECDFKMVTESGRVLLIEHGRTHRLRSEARATAPAGLVLSKEAWDAIPSSWKVPRAPGLDAGLVRKRARAALDELDVIDGIVDDSHAEGCGCPLCHGLDNLREVLDALAATSSAAPEGR